MPKLSAIVTTTRTKGRENIDSEVRVSSIDELYDACRDAVGAKVLRISVRGPEGELRLSYASFIRRDRARG